MNIWTKKLFDKVKENPQFYLTRLRQTVGGILLYPFRPGNIVMFHIGRCGSQVLGSLLEQHPKILWEGEIYRQFKPELYLFSEPISYLRSRMIRAGNNFYGFEFLFLESQHIKALNNFKINFSDYLNKLEKLGFTHFIILERKNYLRVRVSGLIAAQTKRYHQGKHQKPSLTKIKLDVNNTSSLLGWLYEIHRSYQQLESLLDGKKVLRLTYEDDIKANPREAYQRICEFINVDSQPVALRLGRTNPFKLNDMIINFAEVEQALLKTPFEWMLYE